MENFKDDLSDDGIKIHYYIKENNIDNLNIDDVTISESFNGFYIWFRIEINISCEKYKYYIYIGYHSHPNMKTREFNISVVRRLKDGSFDPLDMTLCFRGKDAGYEFSKKVYRNIENVKKELNRLITFFKDYSLNEDDFTPKYSN